MAQYRLLADHFVNNAFLPAGSIVSDTGGGAQLPNGWVPTPYCDPQDADGAQKFFNAGVRLPGLIRSQWTFVNIAPPTTKWVPNPNPTGGAGNPYREYVLTGLGAGLGFAQVMGGASTGAAP